MDQRHKDAILSNLPFLESTVSYVRIRPHLEKLKLFPSSQLERLDRRPKPTLDLFVEVQRRGPTAFRRLVRALILAGHVDCANVLAEADPGGLKDSSISRHEAASAMPPSEMETSASPDLDKQASINVEMDDTDSPLNPNDIRVPQARFLRPEDGMTYKMTSSPRGFALIIDNEEYDSMPPRRGSHVDSECLSQLFCQLGFCVVIRRNLGDISLKFELMTFATDNSHATRDMAIVCILSHGENGTIICRNGEKVLIEDILKQFSNSEAPALKGKPKYFLFQSCRGLEVDNGVETDSPPERTAVGDSLSSGASMALQRAHINTVNMLLQGSYVPDLGADRNPTYEDMMISFATIPGYVAYRNNVKGSWFVQCLCKVFMEYAGDEDLVTLLHRVSRELRNYSTTKGEKQMCETLLRGIYKKLYFNPGISQGPQIPTAGIGVEASRVGMSTAGDLVPAPAGGIGGASGLQQRVVVQPFNSQQELERYQALWSLRNGIQSEKTSVVLAFGVPSRW